MIVTSNDIAVSIETTAQEIAAAMSLYPRLPSARDSLAAATEMMIENLNNLWAKFEQKREAEHAQKRLG